jgi:hypothetical protein
MPKAEFVLDKQKKVERSLRFYNLRFLFILLPLVVLIIVFLLLSLL